MLGRVRVRVWDLRLDPRPLLLGLIVPLLSRRFRAGINKGSDPRHDGLETSSDKDCPHVCIHEETGLLVFRMRAV